MQIIKKRCFSFTVTLIALLSVCTHAKSQTLSESEHVPKYQNWKLEWIEGFKPNKAIYNGKPFDWSLTRLTTDVADPSSWYSFSAGCNRVSRSQSRTYTKDGLQAPKWSIAITQTGCAEGITDGDTTREVISRYSDVEVTLAGILTSEKQRERSYKPQISSIGEYMTWLNDDGAPIAKFKKTHDLVDGRVWEVDRNFHKKIDSFSNRNYFPRIRFFDEKITFSWSCERSAHPIMLNKGEFRLLKGKRPKLCRELVFIDGQLVERPSDTEHYQPLQTAYDGLSNAVRYVRHAAEPDKRNPHIKFFDKNDVVVLQLTAPTSHYGARDRPVRKSAYKGRWQLVDTETGIDGPAVDLGGYPLFSNSCDEALRSNVFSLHENEIEFRLSRYPLDSEPMTCSVSDPKFNAGQARVESVLKNASKYVVDGDTLYLADANLQVLGKFTRMISSIKP